MKLQNIIQQWQQVGAEFLGCTVQYSVSTSGIKINRLRQAILDNPVIPDDWAPETQAPISLYLETVREVASKAARKLIVPPGCNFDMETHKSYTCDKIHQQHMDQQMVSHRVFRKTKTTTNIVDAKVNLQNTNDVELEESCVLTLLREQGTFLDDAKGTSKFDIVITIDNNSDYDSFLPFHNTVFQIFQDKIDGTYTSDQIRTFLDDIIVKRLKCDNIHRGTYFSPVENVEALYELQRVLRDLDKNISLFLLPLPKFKNAPPEVNQSLNTVSQMLGDSIMKDCQSFIDEIESMLAKKDDGTKVRDSTWMKRESDLVDLEKKIKTYRQRSLLETEIIDEMIDEAKQLFKKREME